MYLSVFGQYLVDKTLTGKLRVRNLGLHFGSSTLSLALTLVSDSATLESLFRSNWPLRRSEVALNVEP